MMGEFRHCHIQHRDGDPDAVSLTFEIELTLADGKASIPLLALKPQFQEWQRLRNRQFDNFGDNAQTKQCILMPRPNRRIENAVRNGCRFRRGLEGEERGVL